MARTYAGILGPLAMIATLARGLTHSSSFCSAGSVEAAAYVANPEQMIVAAWMCLVIFAAIGAVIGALANWTVEQSVRDELSGKIAEAETRGD